MDWKSMQKRSSMSEKNWHIQMYSEYRITELHMLSEKTNSEKNRIPDVQTKTKRYPSDYNHLSHDCFFLTRRPFFYILPRFLIASSFLKS